MSCGGAVKALDCGDWVIGPVLFALLVGRLGFAEAPDIARRQARPHVNDSGARVGELVTSLP